MNAPAASETTSDLALPLVIGVTGHRDLVSTDRDALTQAVRDILREIRGRFPQTPLLLLSALADGADRLVADAALQEGIAVVAPLPMRRELYEADFDEASRKDFAAWLDGKVKCWFELPLVEGITEEMVAADSSARVKQYAQVGEYIARHCQVLLALWDGQPGKEGGTEQVFHYKKDGFPILPGSRRSSRLEPVEAALLCQIVTPRRDKPRPADALQWKLCCSVCEEGTDPVPTSADPLTAFAHIFAPVERFNKDAKTFADVLAAERQQSRHYLLGTKEDAWPSSLRPSDAASLGLAPLVERYTLVDSLAIVFQRRTLKTLWLLYAFIFLAVLFFNLGAYAPIKHWEFLVSFLALQVAAYGWYWWSRRRDEQNKYQDYRALAEGVRVQLFWRLAGLGELQAPVADHYLLKHATALDWIRNALRTWSSSWSFPEAAGRITVTQTPPAALPFVVERWVLNQADFFKNRAQRAHARQKAMHFWSKYSVSAFTVLLIAGFVTASCFGVEEWFQHHSDKRFWLNVPLFVVGLLLVVAALTHDYIAKLALTEQAKTYRRMETLFRKAAGLLHECIAAGDERQGQDILQSLVREALVENGDWLLLHRDRPVNVP